MNNKVTRENELQQRRGDKRTVDAVTQVLDEQLESIDETTAARLSAIRQRALAQEMLYETACETPNETLQEKQTKKRGQRVMLPYAAGLAASVLLVLSWQLNNKGQNQSATEDLSPVLASIEQPWEVDEELLDELEFYAWLLVKEHDDSAS